MSAIPFAPALEVSERVPLGEGREGCAALIADIAAKRPGAEKELVDRFKGHVHRLLTRMLGPGPDVEDLLQEVLFRVFSRLHKVVPPDALPGYVTAVAVLVAREALRKRKRARWLSFFSSHDLADLAPAGHAAHIPEDVRSFYSVLAKLPAQSQLCVTLRHVEGMELAEMANAMGVSLATTKRHLQRAEQELTALLGRDVEVVSSRGASLGLREEAR
ncbi:MAG: sigma-70 family RNA polymerase sigma factor [Labilithrix sp.]|nr:sigma-70 family RNA polymerase sigma factor [Labilithrix sp.]